MKIKHLKPYFFWIPLAILFAVASSHFLYYDELNTKQEDNFLIGFGFFIVAPFACVIVTSLFLLIDIFYLHKTFSNKIKLFALRLLVLNTITVSLGAAFYFLEKQFEIIK